MKKTLFWLPISLRRAARFPLAAALCGIAFFGLPMRPAHAQPVPTAQEQLCFDAGQGKLAWNRRGSNRWVDSNLRALCRSTTNPGATHACFANEIRAHDNWQRGIASCAGAAKAPATALIVDPACIAPVAWWVNPEAEDVTLTGCRPASALPSPDAAGWRRFVDSAGGFVDTRGATRNPSTGAFSFDARINSGGSGTLLVKVTGIPTAQGVLKAGTFKVEVPGSEPTPPAQARSTSGLIVDPACIAPAPWMVDPTAVDLKLTGCRPASALAPPDAEGWRRFEVPEGGFVETRGETRNPSTGAISFDARINGGGSGTFLYRVTGVPTAPGVLRAGTFSVVAPQNESARQPAPAEAGANLIVDPACIALEPWMNNPEASDVTLTGCRPASALPAPGEGGWRRFEYPDGRFVETRGETRDPVTGAIRFEARLNGGYGTYPYVVAGVPNPQGVLKAGSFTVQKTSID